MGAASAANDNSINETIISTSDGGSLSVPISESVDDSSLGVSNDAEVLSATYDLSGSTVQDIQTIFNNGVLQPGDTLYLGNQDISSGWTEWNGNEIINVNVPNIIISGGSSSNPNGVSTIDANHAKVFNIQASGVTLTNIKIINSNGGNGPGSAVAVDASDCTITNCEFENCENQYGGAVRATTSASNLKIENCNFSDNRGRWGGFGGAVYLSGPDATVENCIFNNNNAEQYGGAIYSDEEASNTKVIDCTFIDNHGAIGGAIYAGRPGLTVDGCEFEDNTASTSGGAISIYHDDATISNSNFTNNNASIDGGAIYVNDYCYNFNVDSCDFTKNNALGVGDGQGGGAIFIANDCEDITVQNSNFTSNTANTGGGAIRMEYTESMEVENSIFKDNVAKSIYNNPSEVSNGGGAIWSCRGETTIRNSTFERNQGSYGGALRGRVNTYDSDFYLNTAFEGNGGAIDVTIDLNQGSTPDLKYVNTTFVNNTAKGNRDDERAQGGALHMYKINHVDIIDCECYNNTADRGGAIDLYIIGTTNVDNCIIENNSAIHEGGGFFINTTSTPSEFKNTVVSNNDAGTEGGAIFLIANGALFENITSSNNTANIGGSSYIKGNDTTVRNCTLDNNSATTSGGGFYVEGDNCHVEDVILTNNTAEEGGAIYVYGNSAYFDNITSANNTADYYGGSLNVQGDNVIVKNSNFTDNEAFLGGGAIYVSGHEGKFQNNTIDSNEGNMGGGIYVSGDGYEFSDNNVTDNKGVFGGGIVIDGSNTLFTNNNISSNHASSMGGAVYADGENTNFTHNTFSDNTAYWSGGALYVDGENTYLEDIIGNNNTAQNGGFADVDWATNLIVKNSTFIDNHATGNIDDGYGLGGAFHISGSEGVDLEANFYNNTATNGSAIYVEDSTLRVHDSNFFDNQAWSYQLNLTPKPNTRFNRTDDITISVSHQGGDNIANAIHNANGESDVQVKNITYPFYTVDGQVINKTTPKDRYVTPVDSPDADDIYLYDFENNQVITLVLYNGNGSFVYNDETGEYEYVGEGEEINRFTYIVHPLYEIQNQGNEINVTQCGKNSTYTFDDDTGKYVCNNSGKITTCDYESVNPEVDQYTFNESGKITVVLHNKTNNKYTFNLPDGKVTEFYYNETTGEYIFEDNGKQRKYYAIEKTDIYGTIDLPLTKIKGTLDPGNYTVSAFYKESTYYTEIFNYTNFEVIGDLSPNMTVEKVSLNGTDFVIVNDTVAFNITVFNTGGCDLHNVNVTDVFSAGDFTFVGYSEDKGWTRVGESFVFTYGTLAKGENTTFTVWFMTLTNGTLPNNVTARSNETNDTNDTANVTVYSPNMTVEKVSLNGTDFIIVNDTVAFNITVNNTGDCNLYNVTVDELFNSTELEYIVHSNNITWIKNNNTFIYNATLGAGDIIVYEITIYNRGGCTIENITLIDVYNSTELEYVGSIDDNIVVKMDDKIFVNLTMNSNEILKIPLKFKMLVNGTLTNMSPSVDYDIKNGDESADNVTVKRVMKESYPTLHVGESSTFTIWFKAKTNGTLVNNVTARSNETNDTNDTANVTVYSPNMTVEKVSLNITDDVHINDTVAFNITVFNTGDCDLHIVNVSDIFDGNEFTFVGYSEDKGWTRVGNSYVFTYGTLAKGANATFTVWFRTLTNGTLVNNVTARSNETNETNDTANVTVYKRISINVTKVWDDANDQDGIRPDNISVELRNDTGVVDSAVLSADNNWTAVFTDLPVNCNGSAINYTFFEADVDGYKSEVTNSTLYNWTIINTHVPELTEVNVTKVWIDFNDTDGIRPVSVTVMLYANGKNIRNDTLNKSNDWKLTFKDLDKYENGVLINYTIKELAVEGYNTTIHNNTYEFTIVNSHIRPNMTVEKISLNKTVLRGDNTEFIIVVTNTGNCNLTNVKVTEIFNDNELRYINHTNKESWTKSGNVFNYIHALEPNASANFTITFKTLVNGTLINKVNASSNETDNKTGNNTTDVKPVCDLEITKLVNASEVFVNDMVEWSIIVKNNGPNTAENVIVRDTLPDNVEFSVPENCKVEGNTLIWNIGEVRPNESVSLVIVTKLLAEGQFDNFVSVNTTTNESDYTDNEANNTTVANPICDLIINKTVNASSIDVGDSVEWTISVINAGPSTARDVKVKDTLPAGALILSANPSAGSFDKDTRVWEIGSLAANEPVSLILVTQILTEGDITNVAVVNTSTYEPNRTNNEANNTTIANPICDLEIVKLVNASCVYENELVEWTVSVENKGPCVAHDVIVTDALPEGLKLIDSTPSVGTYSNGIWTIGTLEKDATVSLVLITKAAIAGNITNIASVNSTTPDRNTSNNVANNTTEVIPVCDLEIAKLVSSSDVNITDFVEWTIRVANKGPSTAKDVTVTENLPDGLKLINATPSVGSYADGIWTIGDLEKDQVVYLVLETQVVKDGRITNIVVVNSTTPDKNTTNNKANNTTNVKPVCDLEIIKLVSAKKAYVGEELTWTIKVINHGPSAASDVKVSEDIPDSLRFINAIATKGKYNADTQVWTIGKLASGSSETLQIVTKVLSVGNITNPVEVTTSTPDSNKTNNRANNTTEGIPIVDLAVFKYADKEAYHVGDKIEWQITVINYGPCDAHGVVASDVLPDGVKFISFKASKGSYDSSTGRWDIGNLTDGESATLYIYCVALVEGMITNEVNVTCNETDSNPSNNFDNCTVEVIKNETEPPVHPEKPPVTMKETGNPLAYLVMALVVIFGSLWSENRKE